MILETHPMSTSQKGSVVFEGVIKRYGAVTAVRSLDLKIDPGQLVTLLGPSGCGKTTTLRLIAGLESATEGRILIGGTDVTHLSATYRRVSMVFQSYALFPHMTVRENVAYGLTVKATPKAEARARAEEGLALVGLAGYGDRLPSELSGGQQQRVAVARAIVLEPEVLLLDEPLSNLDAKLRRHVREEIRHIQQRLGLTAVYVTHDQEEAMAVSDRIIVMKDAGIAQQGTPRDLYDRPNSPFIADFIGEANLIDCEVIASADGLATIGTAAGELQVRNPLNCNGVTKLAIRPHEIDMLPPDDARSALTGSVRYAAFLGSQIQYTIDSAVGELFVTKLPEQSPFQQGDMVRLHLPTAKTRLVPLA